MCRVSLEEETTQSARHYQLEFNERLLPDLSANIKCGNSLIEWDILDHSAFRPDEETKLRPFDFHTQFDEIMAQGGFDAIVGNPPYVQLSMKEFREERVNRYLPKKYGHKGGRLNTFAFFLDRARDLCKDGGLYAYIIPNTFTTQELYEPLRKNLLLGSRILRITTPVGKVFADAVVENTIVIAKKKAFTSAVPKGGVEFSILNEDGTITEKTETKQSDFEMNHRLSFIGLSGFTRIQRKLQANRPTVGDYTNINQAIALKHDRAACLVQIKQSGLYHEILDGRHIDRYWTGTSPNFFKFDIAKIHSCKREDIFLLDEKIFMRRVGEGLVASLDQGHKYALNTLVVISPKSKCPYDIRFVLAYMNSKIANFYYKHFLKSSKKVFSEIQARQVAQLPLPVLDFERDAEREVHTRIVGLADKMIEAKNQFQNAKTEQQRTFIEAKLVTLDKQIDQAFYGAFGLEPGEVEKIEAG